MKTINVEETNTIRKEWINEILDKCEDMIYKVKTRGEADLIVYLIEFISNMITTNE